MASKVSRAQQETHVGEGLVLGCVAIGETEIDGPQMTLTFAFEHAWSNWQYRVLFPAIRATVRYKDLLPILNMSPRRRSPMFANWEPRGWPFRPYIEDDWEVEELGDQAEKATGVPLSGWVNLAQALLDDLRREPGSATPPPA